MSAVLIEGPSATGRSPAGAITTYRQTHSQPIDLALGSRKAPICTPLAAIHGDHKNPVSHAFSALDAKHCSCQTPGIPSST